MPSNNFLSRALASIQQNFKDYADKGPVTYKKPEQKTQPATAGAMAARARGAALQNDLNKKFMPSVEQDPEVAALQKRIDATPDSPAKQQMINSLTALKNKKLSEYTTAYNNGGVMSVNSSEVAKSTGNMSLEEATQILIQFAYTNAATATEKASWFTGVRNKNVHQYYEKINALRSSDPAEYKKLYNAAITYLNSNDGLKKNLQGEYVANYGGKTQAQKHKASAAAANNDVCSEVAQAVVNVANGGSDPTKIFGGKQKSDAEAKEASDNALYKEWLNRGNKPLGDRLVLAYKLMLQNEQNARNSNTDDKGEDMLIQQIIIAGKDVISCVNEAKSADYVPAISENTGAVYTSKEAETFYNTIVPYFSSLGLVDNPDMFKNNLAPKKGVENGK